MVDVSLKMTGDVLSLADELGTDAEELAAALSEAGLTADAVWDEAAGHLLEWVCDMMRNRDYNLFLDLYDTLADHGVDVDALAG